MGNAGWRDSNVADFKNNAAERDGVVFHASPSTVCRLIRRQTRLSRHRQYRRHHHAAEQSGDAQACRSL